MTRAQSLSVHLNRLSDFNETQASADENLCELATLAAKILAAESCSFIWLTGQDWPEGSAGVSAFRGPAIIDDEAVRHQVIMEGKSILVESLPESDIGKPKRGQGALAKALVSPIKTGGTIVGIVHIRGPQSKSGFDLRDLRLLDIVTIFIGKSMQIVQLQNVLRSRFAQIALAQNGSDVVATAVPPPAQMAKILAKSFYREMTKAGFGADQIINAASQIISELTRNLHKHSKRSRASAKPAATGPANMSSYAVSPLSGP